MKTKNLNGYMNIVGPNIKKYRELRGLYITFFAKLQMKFCSTIIYKICKTLKIILKEFYDSELFDISNIDE